MESIRRLMASIRDRNRREETPRELGPPAEGAALEDVVIDRLDKVNVPFKPETNYRDGRAVRDSASRPLVEEKERDVRRAKEKLKGKVPRWALYTLLVYFVVLEVGSSIALMYELGLALPVAICLGGLLGMGLLTTVYVVARLAARRRVWIWVPIVVLVGLLLSVAVIRSEEFDVGEEEGPILRFAILGISLVMVAGVPVGVDIVLRALQEGGPAWDELADAEAELVRLRVRQAEGEEYVERRTNETAWYEARKAKEAASLRAKYPDRFRPQDGG